MDGAILLWSVDATILIRPASTALPTIAEVQTSLVLYFPRTLRRRQPFPQSFRLALASSGFLEQSLQRLVYLLMAFGKPAADGIIHAFDLKSPRGSLLICSHTSAGRGSIRGNRRPRRISAPATFRNLQRLPFCSASSNVALKTMQCVCRWGSSAREYHGEQAGHHCG